MYVRFLDLLHVCKEGRVRDRPSVLFAAELDMVTVGVEVVVVAVETAALGRRRGVGGASRRSCAAQIGRA